MEFTIAWIIWIGMFLAIEGQALLNDREGDTLSEHVWKWFAIKDKPRWYKLRRFALLAFLAWLTTHFLTGGWA